MNNDCNSAADLSLHKEMYPLATAQATFLDRQDNSCADKKAAQQRELTRQFESSQRDKKESAHV